MIGEQKVDETQNQNVIKSSESSAKSRKSSSTSLPSTAPTYSGTPTTSKSSSSTSSRAKSASSSSSSSSSGSYKIHKIEATKARSRNFIFGAIGHEVSKPFNVASWTLKQLKSKYFIIFSLKVIVQYQ